MGEDGKAPGISLPSAYSILAAKLRTNNSVRQFYLTSEILEMMLRTKV